MFSIDVPTSPTHFSVTRVCEDAISMQWSPPESDGGLSVTGYVVEKRETGRQQFTCVGHTGPNETSIKADNLLEGRLYAFRVMAKNAEGNGEPNNLSKLVSPERPVGEHPHCVIRRILFLVPYHILLGYFLDLLILVKIFSKLLQCYSNRCRKSESGSEIQLRVSSDSLVFPK